MRYRNLPSHQYETIYHFDGEPAARWKQRKIENSDSASLSSGACTPETTGIASDSSELEPAQLRSHENTSKVLYKCAHCGKAYAKVVYFRTHLGKKHSVHADVIRELTSTKPGPISSEGVGVENRTSALVPILQRHQSDGDLLGTSAPGNRDPFSTEGIDETSPWNTLSSLDSYLSSENANLDNEQFFSVDDTAQFLRMYFPVEDPLGSREQDRVPTEEVPSSRKESRKSSVRRARRGSLHEDGKVGKLKKWRVVERREVDAGIKMYLRREFVEISASQGHQNVS